MDATGNRLTGGTELWRSVYDSTNYVTYTGVKAQYHGGSLNLSNTTRTYYAPKDTANPTAPTYLSNVAITIVTRSSPADPRIMRGEYGQVVVTTSRSLKSMA